MSHPVCRDLDGPNVCHTVGRMCKAERGVLGACVCLALMTNTTILLPSIEFQSMNQDCYVNYPI